MLSHLKYLAFSALIIILLFAASAFAQKRTLVKHIRFEKGEKSVVIRGAIQIGDYIDYRFTAKEGQTMTVHLIAESGKMRFQVGAPYGPGPYKGADMVTEWKGALPISGTHMVILYVDTKSARYKLDVTIE